MNVVLVNPAWGRSSLERRRYRRAWPPLDLLNAAALLRRAGHRAVLLDFRPGPLPPARVEAAVRDADLVLFQSTPLDRWQCPEPDLMSLRRLTSGWPRDRLVVAGAHGTALPEHVLDLTGAAALVIGEPERTVAALAAAGGNPRGLPGTAYREGGKTVINPPAADLDLDSIGPPAYDPADRERYGYELLGNRLAVLETSRGCPYACIFCLKSMYGRGLRIKSIDAVMADVEAVRGWGAEAVYFIDLEFSLNKERTTALCRALAGLKPKLKWCCQTRVDRVDEALLAEMKAAGCSLIHFGIESGSPAVLEATGKGVSLDQAKRALGVCRKLGIRTAAFFLLGLPGETRRDRRLTARAARMLDPDFASFHAATPYPGTGLARFVRPDPGDPFPGCLEPEQAGALRRDLRRCYLSFYLRPWKPFRLTGSGVKAVGGARLLLDFIR